MDIRLLQKQDRERWDQFVNRHPQGRFVHLSCYKDILEKTYSYPAHFVYVEENREIVALFPFFELRNIFFKTRFISQPFSEYGGILLKENLAPETKSKAIQALKRYLNVFLSRRPDSYFEIHGGLDNPDLMREYFIERRMGKTAVLRLNSYQEIYDQFDRQIKKALRKARDEGVAVFQEASLESIEDKFYPLYVKYLKKRHGTPPYPRNFFLNCYQYAPQNIKIFFAEKDKKIIAALWGFLANRRIQISYNPSLEEYFIFRPNDLLHARFIQWGCENNFKYFDFGPARYAGQINYKKKWGVEFLEYSHFYLSKRPMDFGPIQPENSSIKILSRIWKSCLPGFIANFIGPFIRRKMGR